MHQTLLHTSMLYVKASWGCQPTIYKLAFLILVALRTNICSLLPDIQKLTINAADKIVECTLASFATELRGFLKWQVLVWDLRAREEIEKKIFQRLFNRKKRNVDNSQLDATKSFTFRYMWRRRRNKDDIYQANSKTIFMIQLLATLLLDWLVDIQTVTRLTYFDKIGYFFLKKKWKGKKMHLPSKSRLFEWLLCAFWMKQ